MTSTAVTEAPAERPSALKSSRDWWVEASTIFGCLLLPIGLLSTNITLNLPIPETMPLAFLAVGLAYVWFRRSIQIPNAAIVVVIVGAYGFAGILGYEPLDGLRVLTAAAVFLIAFQLCADRLLVSRACEVSIYVLTGFRALSIIAPAPIASFYEVLGLRSADLYGGGVAILFQEPSYLATAVFSMWAIAKSGRQESRLEFSMVDVCSVAILLLSGSVSAALYGVAGVAILVRNRWLPIAVLCLSLVAVAASFAAFENTRLGAFLNAVSNLAEHSTIEDAVVAFSLLDPSASYRMSMGFVAVSAGLREPLGHMQLDMSRDTAYVESLDEYGVLSSNKLIDDFFGNLQANSVPLQMLYFGGIPLFLVVMMVACKALWRLWQSRRRDANYLLVIAAIASGCVVQSVMTSPFLYLALAWGLSAYVRRSEVGVGT